VTSRRAFSLVEVIVAVAIVVVLVALTMAVYRSSIRRGHEAECTSNLRQVVQAIELYEAASGKPPMLGNDWRPIMPYVADHRILHCKSDQFPYGANSLAFPQTGMKISYFGVLRSEERFMNALREADNNHGLVVCLTHGERKSLLQEPVFGYRGLVLRARLDGSVQRARPRERCLDHGGGNISRTRTWWDIFTDIKEIPPDVFRDITATEREVPCPPGL
jgi:prepilin-type N-terminal cleavage/methylation domain-containing protein